MIKNPRTWAVLGYHDDTGNIFCHQAVARTPWGAFASIARRIPHSAVFLVAWPWRAMDLELLNYPGDSTVSAETVLEQKEVFK